MLSESVSSLINGSLATDLYGSLTLAVYHCGAQEKHACEELRIPPHLYLQMQEMISRGIFSGSIMQKADAHQFFKIDPSIVDRVYDILVKKGLAPE